MPEFDSRALVQKLKRLGAETRRHCEKALDEEAELVRKRFVTLYWKRKSGDAEKATRVHVLGRLVRSIAVEVPYGDILDRGTRKKNYAIVAKKKALGPMTVGGAGGTFFRRVTHPGLKGFGFVAKERERARTSLRRRVLAAIKSAGR